MKKLFYLFLLTLAGGNLYAQGTSEPKIVREANTAFESGKYYEAIEKLQAAYDKIGTKSAKERGKVRFKLAEAYRHISRYQEANENYDVCIDLGYFDVNADVYFLKGEMLRMMGQYGKARKSYIEFKKISKGARAQELEIAINACEEYKYYETYPEPEVNYEFKNVTKINRKEYDMAPVFADKKGLKIYFSSSRDESFGSGRDPITGEKYMDIYEATFQKDGNLEGIRPIDEEGIVNTSQNEGSVCFDKKFKTMYFTRCPSKERTELGCEIWIVDIEEGQFTNPRKMNLKQNDTISVGHPCLSLDGKKLIFASDMKESGGVQSFGGRDLWYVEYHKKSKQWDSIPKNMGSAYNTSGNELFPSIGKTGKLFFASDGHKGIGGLDIFYANPVADEVNKWSEPKNMGYPINSPSNDYGIADRGENGYFTSERGGVDRSADIWSYSVPPNLFDLKVIVHEFGSPKDRIENAEVTVVSSDESTWSGPTDAKGSTIKWDVKNGRTRYIMEEMEYSINATKEGYMINKESAKISTVGLGESQSFIVEIELVHIEEELRAPEVRYPLNQWTFINDETCMSKDSLLFLSDLLSSHPYITIDLFSHTDSRSSAKYNQVLSENRAKAVYKFLVEEKGIDPRRIQPVGMGEADPATWIDENGAEIVLTESYINKFRSTDKAKFEKLHQINRRTTARITSQEFDSNTAPVANPEWMEFKPLR
jgi:hypothetical protein